MAVKKLIEVALPLEKINAESAREKSIRHGHPSTLHLWWARRPLAAARAVIWASLVDDPSSHPELFSTEEDQTRERRRLFSILENLVIWENSNDPSILEAARKEIRKSTDDNLPVLLDPFSGGGAIPLEAQRLGLETYAHDLNPVAVMINKALIEIPPRFSGKPPINPASSQLVNEGWQGARGMAEDICFYGNWLKQEAYKRIGHLYPKVKVPQSFGGGEATVIAWIWARTMKCPNPACGCIMPLASSFVLSKQRGNEVWVKPVYQDKKLSFQVNHSTCPQGKESNKTGPRGTFTCPNCGEATSPDYTKSYAQSKGFGYSLMAIVADGKHGRIYCNPDIEQVMAASIDRPSEAPFGSMSEDRRAITPPDYGMPDFADLFTSRQLKALTTFSDLIPEAQRKAEADAVLAGMPNDHIPLSEDGRGAMAYGQAIGVYLAFAVDRLAMTGNSLVRWNSTGQKAQHCFGRQALPMLWDFAEPNFFGNATGSLDAAFFYASDPLSYLPASGTSSVKQFDAQSDCGLRKIMISTDPPYYDNIGYADLSDFFYIWMRRSLKETYPSLFSTMLVPKTEELIATPYRHEGDMDKAKSFFEKGMLSTCSKLFQYARDDIPVTIYYAYKQSDSDEISEGSASSGWETMLSAIIQAGFAITGTWPIRTEMATRMRGQKSNALASSIVIVCRKRSSDASVCTRRNFINELKRELRPALQKLQSSNIAPVDLAQSAIGPGMGVYSKYKQVLEADGTPMTVRSALKIINQELDLFFNEQDGEMDNESRFCVDLYSQVAFNDLKFGDANTLATAKNTSVAILASHGTLYAQKGVVHLIERSDLPKDIKSSEESIWLLCQQLTYLMEKEGVEGCAKAVSTLFGSNSERAKDLAYRLYTIAERKKWAQEAYAYNTLVVAWPEIQSRAAELSAIVPQQMSLEDLLNE